MSFAKSTSTAKSVSYATEVATQVDPLHDEHQSSDLRIRVEEPRDQDAIREIHKRAFGGEIEADLVDRLRVSCPVRLSLVAERDSRPVGHILFTPAVIESPARRVVGMGLAPLAVLPEFQRRGIGGQLVEECLSRLRLRGEPFVVVLGHGAYYCRFGFRPASEYRVACEFEGVPDEAFMILVLDGDAFGEASGVARYRPEFRDLA
jgi:putative acetyltransferase